jgi:hypothetical protein
MVFLEILVGAAIIAFQIFRYGILDILTGHALITRRTLRPEAANSGPTDMSTRKI